MGVTNITNVDQYNQLIKSGTTIALFSAEDVAVDQCKQLLDVMRDLSTQCTALQFINVPAEDLSVVSLKHQIEAVPTVLFLQNGSAVDRIDGVDVAALTAKCKKLAGAAGESKEALEERLRALINRAKVMIFMKGDRTQPRCGFSKQLIQIVNETGLKYETFDILSDEEVRQGLKTFSDWPTYPQVYVNGELIGGLDIVKEMLQNGELIQTLNG